MEHVEISSLSGVFLVILSSGCHIATPKALSTEDVDKIKRTLLFLADTRFNLCYVFSSYVSQSHVVLCVFSPKANALELLFSKKQKQTVSTFIPACEQPKNNKLMGAQDKGKTLLRKLISGFKLVT